MLFWFSDTEIITGYGDFHVCSDILKKITFTVLLTCSPLPVSGSQKQQAHESEFQFSQRRMQTCKLYCTLSDQDIQTIFLTSHCNICLCINLVPNGMLIIQGFWVCVAGVEPVKMAGCSSVEVKPRWWRNFISLTYCNWWHRETEETETNSHCRCHMRETSERSMADLYQTGWSFLVSASSSLQFVLPGDCDPL